MKKTGLFLAFLVSGLAGADEGGPADGKTPLLLRFRMMDGSVLIGAIAHDELRMETKYGTLDVPARDIRSFTPGLDSKPKISLRIVLLIERLGSDVVEEREEAQKELIALGLPVREEVRRFLKGADQEQRARLEKILQVFHQHRDVYRTDDERCVPRAWIAPDEIVAEAFSARGELRPKVIELVTRFGPMKIRMRDVDSAERVHRKGSPRGRWFSLTSEHIAQRRFRSTGITLAAGDLVTITAEGTLLMTPWGTGKSSSPEGNQSYGWYNQVAQIPAGALVGRIGCTGTVFKIGVKYTFKVSRTGTLHLGIGMNPSYIHNSYPGTYTVKVASK